MIRTLIRALIMSAVPLAAQAQDGGPAAIAAEAARAIEAAQIQLDQADGGRDRVAALTTAVQAYETGLGAMRDGMRDVAIREQELTLKLAEQDADTSQLLGVLAGLGGQATPETLAHPGGPVGAARAGMLLEAVMPGLQAQAETLQRDLSEVSALRSIQERAIDVLKTGLSGLQEARADLSKAIADRTDLPRKFTEDSVRTAILISGSETLAAFASGLSNITTDETAVDLPDVAGRKGMLAFPVTGQVLRRPGEADAAGIARPGIVVATGPGALVVAPAAATLRYSGPLLDYGLVSILEPQPGILFVFAGLSEVFGETGQILPEGSPVGLMGGETLADSSSQSFLSESAGGARLETLYIEVRVRNAPDNPLLWFEADKE